MGSSGRPFGKVRVVIIGYVMLLVMSIVLDSLRNILFNVGGPSWAQLSNWLIPAIFVGFGVVFAVKNYLTVLKADVLSKKGGSHV